MGEIIGIVANIFTCVSMLIALCEFYFFYKSIYADYERSKKQATIDLYTEHYNDIIQLNHEIYLRYQRKKVPIEEIKSDDEFKQILKQYLNWMEWISTGINTDIYNRICEKYGFPECIINRENIGYIPNRSAWVPVRSRSNSVSVCLYMSNQCGAIPPSVRQTDRPCCQ